MNQLKQGTIMSTGNDHLVLISGSMTSGKSHSLMYIDNPEGVMYLNCDSGKRLPFKDKFLKLTITDPYDVLRAVDEAESMPNIHTIVVDTFSYLMEMYHLVYVRESTNTQQAWGELSSFVNDFFLQYCAKSTKTIIVLGHTIDKLNEGEGVVETFVGGSGSVMKKGIEGFFSTVLTARKVPIKKFTEKNKADKLKYECSDLIITEDDEDVGYKHVFQTKLTKETVGERIRSSIHMWSNKETYIDNNMQTVINRLNSYYSKDDEE